MRGPRRMKTRVCSLGVNTTPVETCWHAQRMGSSAGSQLFMEPWRSSMQCYKSHKALRNQGAFWFETGGGSALWRMSRASHAHFTDFIFAVWTDHYESRLPITTSLTATRDRRCDRGVSSRRSVFKTERACCFIVTIVHSPIRV